MDHRYPFGRATLDEVAAGFTQDDLDAVGTAMDAYEVDIPPAVDRHGFLDAVETGDTGHAATDARIVTALRELAGVHEEETGETPDWERTINYRELPGIEREVFDHWSARATYVDAEQDYVYQVPTRGTDLRSRLASVFTWQHNRDRIAAQGLHVAPPYDIFLTEIEGDLFPVAVTAYNDDLQRYEELETDRQADWYGSFERVASTLADLVEQGEVAAAVPNDYWYGGTPSGNLALDTAEQEVFVVDVGELGTLWEKKEPIPYDAREFLAGHGIDEQVDAYLERVALD